MAELAQGTANAGMVLQIARRPVDGNRWISRALGVGLGASALLSARPEW
jgi:hypothetical protein